MTVLNGIMDWTFILRPERIKPVFVLIRKAKPPSARRGKRGEAGA
jgi:hypothetical protein